MFRRTVGLGPGVFRLATLVNFPFSRGCVWGVWTHTGNRPLPFLKCLSIIVCHFPEERPLFSLQKAANSSTEGKHEAPFVTPLTFLMSSGVTHRFLRGGIPVRPKFWDFPHGFRMLHAFQKLAIGFFLRDFRKKTFSELKIFLLLLES
jgi:hypothetical protein